MKKTYFSFFMSLVLMATGSATAQNAAKNQAAPRQSAEGTVLWGNIVNKDTPTSNGMYKFSTTSIDPVSMVTGSKFVANAGSVYHDGHFRFVNADYTYASQGYISGNMFDYTVGENDTWTSSGKHKSMNVNMLGLETAFDRKTGKVYGEFYKDKNLQDLEFCVVDYTTSERTVIGPATHTYVAIGLTSDLTMYGIATDGKLYSISTTDGTETEIGATGLTLLNSEGTCYAQSGEIDQRDNTFYWAATDAEGNSALYTVDLTTGAATKLNSFPNGENIYALTIPYPIAEDNAPSYVTNLKATFDKDNTNGKVSFKAPAITFAGEILEGEVTYHVSTGSTVIAEGTATPGEKVNVEVTGVEKQTNSYTVWTSNETGDGPKKNVEVYVGMDTPSYSLSNLKLEANGTDGLVLSWDALEGAHGGYIGDVTYNVLRNGEETVAEGLTEPGFTDNIGTPEQMTSYYYLVNAICGSKKVSGKSNAVTVGDHVNVPYSTEFASETDFNIFSVYNVNEDKSTWQYYSYTPKSAQYSASYNSDADDWLITPPTKVRKGKTYIVKFKARESNTKYTNKFSVAYGEGNTVEAMTTPAFAEDITVTSKEEEEYTFSVKAEKDMMLGIGFHVTSEKSNGSLYITNFSIEEDPTSPTPEIKDIDLWGNIVNQETPTSNGMYKFRTTAIDPVSMVTGSKFVANAGSVYHDGHFRFVNADYTYASQGYISGNLFDYTIGENDTWTSSGKHKSMNVNMLALETAFDRKTGKVYGEFYKDKDLKDLEFCVVDYTTSERTVIGPATHTYVAIGLTSDLTMYGIATDGKLYSISTTDGTETEIGATGLTLLNSEGTCYAQSGEIDQRDDIFYWAATDAEGNSALYVVDLNTGNATKVGSFPNGERIYALTIPYPIAEDNAPSYVTNLKATFDKDNTNGKVSFKAPAITFAGEILEGEVTYHVSTGSTVIAEGTATPGEKVNVEVTGVEKQTNSYTVWTSNETGDGPKKNVEVYVGMDTPSYSLSNLKLEANGTDGLVLSWDALEGAHGGYIGDVTYNVLRNGEETVAEGLTEPGFTDNIGTPEQMTSYYYLVNAICGSKKVSGKSNAVTLGDHVNVPYSTEFASETDFNIFSVYDVNEDKSTWQYYSYTPKSAQYSASYNNDADDWFITPPVKVLDGKTYNVKFSVKESNTKYTNKFAVAYGEGTTVEAMTTPAFADEITVTSKEEEEHTFSVKAEKDMLLGIGFHVTSEKSNGSLYITKFSIEEDTTLGINGINNGMNNNTDIYSIDGQKVRINATDTNGLKQGVYIMNGKKVVIK